MCWQTIKTGTSCTAPPAVRPACHLDISTLIFEAWGKIKKLLRQHGYLPPSTQLLPQENSHLCFCSLVSRQRSMYMQLWKAEVDTGVFLSGSPPFYMYSFYLFLENSMCVYAVFWSYPPSTLFSRNSPTHIFPTMSPNLISCTFFFFLRQGPPCVSP